ncbi:hypothetical protein MMPV_009189 [Pyropia vietnamensis]
MAFLPSPALLTHRPAPATAASRRAGWWPAVTRRAHRVARRGGGAPEQPVASADPPPPTPPPAAAAPTADAIPGLAAATAAYITDTAGVPIAAPALSPLLHALYLHQGYSPLPPDAARAYNIHPLVIPLGVCASNSGGGGEIIGLLRWPTPTPGAPLPVVTTGSTGGAAAAQLVHLATSPAQYVHRAAAAADDAGNAGLCRALIAATADSTAHGFPPAAVYTEGSVAALGMGIERYCLLKIGPFMDLYRGLAAFHAAKADNSSALVTCERAAGAFVGWGAMHVFHSGVLTGMGRPLEARDAARAALQLPLWTLGPEHMSTAVAAAGAVGAGQGFGVGAKAAAVTAAGGDGGGPVAAVAVAAGYTGVDSLRRIYERMAGDERLEEVAEGKEVGQVALDRAAYAMDAEAIRAELGTGDGWNSVREELAALYEVGRLEGVAAFLRA